MNHGFQICAWFDQPFLNRIGAAVCKAWICSFVGKGWLKSLRNLICNKATGSVTLASSDNIFARLRWITDNPQACLFIGADDTRNLARATAQKFFAHIQKP
jgi:ABC-type thiamine transport system substrate-binding protein